MGKLQAGAWGNVQNKVGNLVGRVRLGQNTLSVYQPNVANPQTMAQNSQRAKFKLMSSFISAVIGMASAGFKSTNKPGQSGGNQAFSFNVKNAVTGSYPNFAVDYPNVVLSMGALENVENPTATDDGSGHIDFSWNNNAGDGFAIGEDKVMICVYNHDKKKAISLVAAADRADQSYQFTTPNSWSSDTAHMYIATKSQKHGCSKSEYLGSVVLS